MLEWGPVDNQQNIGKRWQAIREGPSDMDSQNRDSLTNTKNN